MHKPQSTYVCTQAHNFLLFTQHIFKKYFTSYSWNARQIIFYMKNTFLRGTEDLMYAGMAKKTYQTVYYKI